MELNESQWPAEQQWTDKTIALVLAVNEQHKADVPVRDFDDDEPILCDWSCSCGAASLEPFTTHAAAVESVRRHQITAVLAMLAAEGLLVKPATADGWIDRQVLRAVADERVFTSFLPAMADGGPAIIRENLSGERLLENDRITKLMAAGLVQCPPEGGSFYTLTDAGLAWLQAAEVATNG